MESQRLLDFPCSSTVKKPPAMQETACNAGDVVSTPGSERSPTEGNGTHSSIPAWEVPWTEEPGRLQFMGSQALDMT